MGCRTFLSGNASFELMVTSWTSVFITLRWCETNFADKKAIKRVCPRPFVPRCQADQKRSLIFETGPRGEGEKSMKDKKAEMVESQSLKFHQQRSSIFHTHTHTQTNTFPGSHILVR